MNPTCPGCGKEFDSKAALEGHTVGCPDVDESDGEQPADNSNTTMTDSDTTQTDADEQFKQEVEAILPGKDTFDNLRVTRTGFAQYEVLSTRNSGITLHTVYLNRPSCTCADWQYNTEEGEREICAHYAAAFIDAGDIAVEDLALGTLTTVLTEVRNARDELEGAVDMASGAAVEARGASATAAQATADASPNKAPGELVDKLRKGLENADMTVNKCELSGEEVAFDVYFDGDFDELKRVTSECGLVSYDGDNNAILLGNVEQYVEEVL